MSLKQYSLKCGFTQITRPYPVCFETSLEWYFCEIAATLIGQQVHIMSFTLLCHNQFFKSEGNVGEYL